MSDAIKRRRGRTPGSYPLYRRIADHLKSRLNSGEWTRDGVLPSRSRDQM